MALILPRRLKPVTGLADMTPLLNVVLLLLIFFLLSSSFVLQPGIKIDPPHTVFESGSPTSRLVVVITMTAATQSENGGQLPRQPILFFEDQIVTLDGLKAAFEQLGQQRNGSPVVLKADKDVPLDFITQVADLAFSHRRSVVIATQPASSSPNYDLLSAPTSGVVNPP